MSGPPFNHQAMPGPPHFFQAMPRQPPLRPAMRVPPPFRSDMSGPPHLYQAMPGPQPFHQGMPRPPPLRPAMPGPPPLHPAMPGPPYLYQAMPGPPPFHQGMPRPPLVRPAIPGPPPNRPAMPGAPSLPPAMPRLPPFHQATISVELDLIRVYGSLVTEEFQRNIESSDVRFLERVKEAYCKRTIEDRQSDVTFEHPGMRCAYIFLNTPCFSSVVAFHFRDLLDSNPWLFKRALYHESLSVCCLGCGPAPELLAIVKVFEMLLKFHRLSKRVAIRATVVDVDGGWQATAKWITQNWWKHFDTSLVQLRLTFVQADLTKPVGSDVREAVGRADVVTMVKFFSAVYGTDKRDRIPFMFQEITDCLPVGGVLFYMNSFRFSCPEDLREVMASGHHMTTIYNSDYVYRLSNQARVECLQFYSEYYGWTWPTVENKSNVIAWYKRNPMKTKPS